MFEDENFHVNCLKPRTKQIFYKKKKENFIDIPVNAILYGVILCTRVRESFIRARDKWVLNLP